MGKNYSLITEEIIKDIKKKKEVPTLLLHSCCAPCSSSVIEYLSQFFRITVFFYNPNITNKDEYKKRLEEQKRFIDVFGTENPVEFIEGPYDTDKFFDFAEELREDREGGWRCVLCYTMRMKKTAQTAYNKNFDYFTTTLTLSPLKNAGNINEIGKELEKNHQIKYLYSDFKKRDGYKRSIELSKEYFLYRQNYCGCDYSK